MINLSKRLNALEEWIDQDVIADIGCDHGYLACHAILSGKAKKAYACDVARGPLENAKKTVCENGLEKKVECRLQNGLQTLPEGVDLAILAGMGGLNMIDILNHSPYPVPHLLLSPHKDAGALRFTLKQKGYWIEKEKVIEEDGHFYPVILVHFDPDIAKDQCLEKYEVEWGYRVQSDEYSYAFFATRLQFWTELSQKVKGETKEKALLQIEYLQQTLDNLMRME